MRADSDEHLVRYLLGDLPDAEAERLDERSITDEAFALRLRVLENDLIDRYARGEPFDASLERLDRLYRASAYLRDKVQFAEALHAVTAAESAGQPARPAAAAKRFRVMAWASLATAALLIIVLGGWWATRTRPAVSDTRDGRAATRPAQESAPVTRPAPNIFAVSISPINVRSAGDSFAVVIPSGTDVVRLRLEGDAQHARVEGARARVRTVNGAEVWRGPAEAPNDVPAGTIAQIDVPAVRLPVDDYVIELFGTDTRGLEYERSRYFLSVRPH
jgi:hypothetical protein